MKQSLKLGKQWLKSCEKSNYTWFHVKALTPQVATTSLYQQSFPIHLQDFDQASQRLRYTALNGAVQVIEPLTQTQTKLDIHLPQQSLAAPLQQKMDLAEVKVYQNDQLLRSFSIENQINLDSINIFAQFSNWLNDLWHQVKRKAKIML